MSGREGLVARFKELTERVLPERAREERWPLRLDHCFKRVCLDYAFGDVWYKHVAKPAERHLEGEALERAVRCAEELAAGGRALLAERNGMSLRWRGKGEAGSGIRRLGVNGAVNPTGSPQKTTLEG